MSLEWISIDDKMPEKHKDVLIYDRGVHVAHLQEIVNGKPVFADGHLWNDYDVNYWMELPKEPNNE